MLNQIVLIGKLVSVPMNGETSNGVKLSNIVLEVERPYRNNFGVREKDYVSCILWKALSEQVMDFCEIGSYLCVKGRLQSHTIETTQYKEQTILEVKAEHVEFLDKYFYKKV